MRKKLLLDIGGLEASGIRFEDLHLGNTLYRMGYKIVLGPLWNVMYRKLREKILQLRKRIATGIRAHIAVELPAFIVMLFWYWAMFIWAAVTWNKPLLYLSFIFMGIRTIHGILQRLVTMNKIKLSDFYIPLFFDLFGTFYLMCAFRKPEVVWRGIRYEVRKGGYIEAMDLLEDDLLEEHVQED